MNITAIADINTTNMNKEMNIVATVNITTITKYEN